MQKYKRDLRHVGSDKFKLLDLDEVFSLKDHNLGAFELYFKERDRIKCFKQGKHVYAKVKNFIFLLPFPYGIYELIETFYNEIYNINGIRNGNIVDIGAFIGDTAIYFASKGAKKVIAFEPAKNLFYIALQNVQLNGLGSIICMRNEAIGLDYNEENLYYIKTHPGSSSMVPPKRGHFNCYKVKVVPLSSVLANFEYIDLLKIDCEGTEDMILLHAHDAGLLKHVSSVIVEVHSQEKLKMIKKIFEKESFKIQEKQCNKIPCLISATRM